MNSRTRFFEKFTPVARQLHPKMILARIANWKESWQTLSGMRYFPAALRPSLR
jgi:hypothetical protein